MRQSIEKFNILVSVIIANFNGEKFLERCLNSIFQEKESDFEVIVVDDGSTDKSLNLLKGEFAKEPRLKVIALGKNQGAAKARNIGVKQSSGKYLLFLDNDTKIKQGWFKEIIRFFQEHPGAGLAQAKILKIGTNQFDYAGDLLTPFGFLAERARSAKDEGQFDKTEKIFALKSAGMLARREVFEKLGGFDEDFEIFWEDTDIAWRCWLFGWEVLFAPEIIVWHAYGTDEKPAKISASYQVTYRGCRNMIASLIKNFGLKKLILAAPINVGCWLVLSLLFSLKLDFQKSWAIVKGVAWNFVNLKLTLKKRKKIQATRKITDKQFYSLVGTRKNVFYYFGKALAYLTNKPF